MCRHFRTRRASESAKFVLDQAGFYPLGKRLRFDNVTAMFRHVMHECASELLQSFGQTKPGSILWESGRFESSDATFM